MTLTLTRPPQREAPPGAAPRFAALRVRDYRWYFITCLLTMTADSIEHVISYWVIFQKFHSPTLGGFAVISHWLPFLFLSVYVGALADRYDCRKLIQVSQALFALASVAWAVLILTDSLEVWHAAGLLLIHGVAGVIGVPATQLILHDLVGGAQVPSAIRLGASSRYLSILLGPAIGGGLMLLLGPGWGLLFNVLVYLPLSLFLWRLPDRGQARRAAPSARARVGLGEAMRVFRSVRADRRIVTMILLAGAGSFFVGNAFQPQMPQYAHDLGSDDAGVWYSVLLGANAAGAVLGAVLLESFNVLRPRVRTAILCAGAWGLTMMLFSTAGSYRLAVALLVLAGVLDIAFTSMAQTLVQLLAPQALRGRVVGLFNTAVLGLRAGSGLTIGLLGAVISIHWSLALSAAALVVICASLFVRELRAGTSGDLDGPPAARP